MGNTTKMWLVVLLWATGIADAVTFYLGNLHQFEINSLYIWTGSAFFVIFFKFVVLAGMHWMISKYQPTKTYLWSYIIIFTFVVAISGQMFGTWSNLQTRSEYLETVGTPQEIQPMQPTEAVKSFAKLNFIALYIPLIFGSVSFWVWSKLYEVKP